MATEDQTFDATPEAVEVDTSTSKFALPVDENNKAKAIRIFSIKRPHMRAFHFAWFSFFLAFFGWFALAPLQKKIRDHPNNRAWLNAGSNFRNQNIIAVSGTILMRLLIGPFCDAYGPRIAQTLLIGVFAIPVSLVGTARNFASWTIARFFIGFIGASFVVTQFWTSVMFSGNIVGTANATSAGWGNLGGGVTQAVMPQLRKGVARAQGFKSYDGPKLKADDLPAFCAIEANKMLDPCDDRSWRIAMVIPAIALILTAVALYLLSDDLPDGNYRSLEREGKKKKKNGFKTMGRAVTNWRSWILFMLYAGCFGIELLMNGNLAVYFSGNDGKEAFGLSEGTAGLAASLFGLMNLFARSVGGIGSDYLASRFGIRGRLWWFFFVQLAEGILFIIFSRIRILGAALPILICFSLFVQMAEGATFAIVPFVDPEATGAISGIVGAGGNFGAVTGGFLINSKVTGGISRGFRNLGFIVVGTALLIPLLWWPQHGSMFTKPTITAEEATKEATKEVVSEETE